MIGIIIDLRNQITCVILKWLFQPVTLNLMLSLRKHKTRI